MSEFDHITQATVKVLMKNTLATLGKHYPLYNGGWRVRVDNRKKGGVMHIFNDYLSGQMGFVLHLTEIDPEGKAVIRAGGEILERYRQSRAKNGNIRDRLNELRVTRIGEAVYDK